MSTYRSYTNMVRGTKIENRSSLAFQGQVGSGDISLKIFCTSEESPVFLFREAMETPVSEL